MKENLVELVFIMDRSGSMYFLEKDCVGGFNAMLNKQKQEVGNAYVTTYLFNHQTTLLHDRLDIKEVNEMKVADYLVGGSTALYDCLGEAINHVEMIHKYIRKEDQPEQVIFVITTDGYENASHNYSQRKIKKMIQEKTKKGWEFIYLAANIDAQDSAAMMGIAKERAQNYHHDAQGISNVFDSVSDAISHCRINKKMSDSWNQKVAKDYNSRKGKK